MSATTTTTTNSLRMALHCPFCRRVLGETDGHALYIGGAWCDRAVTLRCLTPGCTGRKVWQPCRTHTTEHRSQVTTDI